MAQLSDREIAGVAEKAGFTGNDLAIAVAVALAESGGKSDARNTANSNGSIDYGLFQINSIHAALLRTGSWENPYDNARFARSVWQGAGGSWTPWVTYNTGAYQQFMARGNAAAGQPSSPNIALSTNSLSDQPILVPEQISPTYHTGAVCRIPQGWGGYSNGLAILFRPEFTQALGLAVNRPRATMDAYTLGWEGVPGTGQAAEWGVLGAQRSGKIYGVFSGGKGLRASGPKDAQIFGLGRTFAGNANNDLFVGDGGSPRLWFIGGNSIYSWSDGGSPSLVRDVDAHPYPALVHPWGKSEPEVWRFIEARNGWFEIERSPVGGGGFSRVGRVGPLTSNDGFRVWRVVRDSRRSNRLWLVMMQANQVWHCWSANNGRSWSKPLTAPTSTMAAANPGYPRPSVTHANTGNVLFTMDSGATTMLGAPVNGDYPASGAAAGRYNLGPVKPWVAAAAAEIGPKFGISTIYGVGSRPNLSDHPKGLALDFMVSDVARGTALANYVIANAGRLRGTYLIWRQAIHSFDSRGWRIMEDRGSPTANHMDHVHVSFF